MSRDGFAVVASPDRLALLVGRELGRATEVHAARLGARGSARARTRRGPYLRMILHLISAPEKPKVINGLDSVHKS
jgi:hypothetical protein